MDRRLLVVLSCLVVACAPVDVDVTPLVEVRPAGALPRVTFAGVGVGASREAAVAAFGDGLGLPGDGAYLGTIPRGGAGLEVLWNVRGGRVDLLSLAYTGSRAARREAARQWSAVLAAAGAECDERGCWLMEGDVTVARLDPRGEADAGPQVTVTLYR